MTNRTCQRCVYACPMQDGRSGPLTAVADALVCVNRPDAPGEVVRVDPCACCRNFRARREPAVWTVPPKPRSRKVKHIGLTKGKYAIVDAADYKWLSRYKWTALVTGGKVYAIRACKGKTILMHREIMKPARGLVVDHIDGNGLNNCRSNLRVCTRQQNLYNSRPRAKKSKYKGVRYCDQKDNWIAEATLRGHKHHLGTFRDEVEAARAYDRKAAELFGKYARLNFPQGGTSRGPQGPAC